MRSDQEPVRMDEKRPPAQPGAADRLDDGKELDDKQQGNNVGQDRHILGTAGEHLDHGVGIMAIPIPWPMEPEMGMASSIRNTGTTWSRSSKSTFFRPWSIRMPT